MPKSGVAETKYAKGETSKGEYSFREGAKYLGRALTHEASGNAYLNGRDLINARKEYTRALAEADRALSNYKGSGAAKAIKEATNLRDKLEGQLKKTG